MRIREPRAGWMVFLWVWALFFGGIPLFILFTSWSGVNRPPVPFILVFVGIAAAVVVGTARWSLRAGFRFEEDGIHGAHDAERTVVPWEEVQRLTWQWAEETSGMEVNGRPLPDGYALHAVLRDGRTVRLMQRVAPRYGQQQDLNDQLARAAASGALPVPFDAMIPTHDGGEWSGTPPPRNHTTWTTEDLPPAQQPSGDEPFWPTS